MKKHFWCVVLLLLLVIGSFMFFTADRSSVTAYAVDYEAIMKAQQRAVDANDLLNSTFDFTLEYPYPDDYSGDWVSDSGDMVIWLTSDDNIDDYKTLLSEYADIIEYRFVDHSFNELLLAVKELGTGLEHEIYVKEFGPDILNNSIFITFSEEASQDNYDILYKYVDVTENGYAFTYKGDTYNVEITWDEPEVDEEVSYHGGSPLNLTSSGYCQTMSCNGYYNNHLGFVTCGHSQVLGHVMYSNGSFVGVTSYVNYPTVSTPNVTGDFSFINSVAPYGTTITSSPYYYNLPSTSLMTFVGVSSQPLLGSVLYKYGQTSGKTTVQVSSLNVSRTVNLSDGSTGHISGLSIANILSGTSAGGDSGGPYTYESKFAGVHNGSTVSSGGNTVYFTPAAYVLSAGVSIVTN